MAKKKERLDKLLVDRGLVSTRSRAKALVMAGEVLVDGQQMIKPGMPVRREAELSVVTPNPYVGRGGFKLAGALERFELDVSGRVCADVGACTGGFTDVLLQNGAARVFAIDVGYGHLDWKLRQDDRVVVMERTNARYLETLGETVNLVTIDVSFISLKLILPVVKKWLAADGDIIALIKPQFEAGPKQVGKGGIVRDPQVHRQVLTGILNWSAANGLTSRALMRSTIQGTDGNVEFLVWLKPGAGETDSLEIMIEKVFPD